MKKEVNKAPDDLVELNLELQNKNIELLNAMHTLTKRIDHLINIFEEAAKNLSNVEDDTRVKELTEKLENLLEQNKTISNSLVLLERYVKNRSLETPLRKI